MDELEVIKAGRKYLIDHGWIKGALVDPDGNVCALGALAGGYCNLRGTTLDQYLREFESCPRNIPAIITSAGFAVAKRVVWPADNAGSLPIWNDKIASSKTEVLAAFDRTIRDLEAEAEYREYRERMQELVKIRMPSFLNPCGELGDLPTVEKLTVPEEWTKVSYKAEQEQELELVPA